MKDLDGFERMRECGNERETENDTPLHTWIKLLLKVEREER